MPVDLDKLGEERTRWLPLGGEFAGVEVFIRKATPREQERFRQHLVRMGIMRMTNNGASINGGREDDFFSAFAKQYITDWRGDIKPEGTDYKPELMGKFLGASLAVFEQISAAVQDEVAFLASNGNG